MGVQSAGGVRGVPISVGSGKAWLMRVRVGQEITVLQSKSGQGSLWVKGGKAVWGHGQPQ